MFYYLKKSREISSGFQSFVEHDSLIEGLGRDGQVARRKSRSGARSMAYRMQLARDGEEEATALVIKLRLLREEYAPNK